MVNGCCGGALAAISVPGAGTNGAKRGSVVVVGVVLATGRLGVVNPGVVVEGCVGCVTGNELLFVVPGNANGCCVVALLLAGKVGVTLVLFGTVSGFDAVVFVPFAFVIDTVVLLVGVGLRLGKPAASRRCCYCLLWCWVVS